MKKVYIILFLIGYSLCVAAQSYGNLSDIVRNNLYSPIYNPAATPPSGTSRDFLPVSPNAGSLGLYGQIPVGNYTGVADISIPLFTMEYKELSVPISLNYHTGGNKPDAFPGPVGLGWSFRCAGVISRVIKGYPDDGECPSDGGGIGPMINQRAQSDWSDIGRMASWIDTQSLAFTDSNDPDEFYFELNGQSGKFYVDHKDTFRVQSIQGHSFQIIKDPVVSKEITFLLLEQTRKDKDVDYLPSYTNKVKFNQLLTGFTMIDDHGVRYRFGGDEKSIEFSRPGLVEYITDPELYICPTSWNLVSIQSPNGYTIDFKYQQQTIITRSYYSDVVMYRKSTSNLVANPYARCANYQKNTLINGCYLTEITSPSGKIVLDNSMATEQLDYPLYDSYSDINLSFPVRFQYYNDVSRANTEKIGYGASVRNRFFPQKIDALHIYDKMGRQIRKINFVYGFYPERNYRLKLFDVRITGEDGSELSYNFKYNFLSLPYYGAWRTDLYGYYNGKRQFEHVDPDSFIGYMMDHPDYLDELKQPDFTYAQAEILTDIYYPTRGHSHFEYEPHEYGSTYHTWPFYTEANADGNKETAGLRIKSVRNYDKDNKLLSEKKYHYVKNYLSGGTLSSGVLAYRPQFVEKYENKYYVNGNTVIPFNYFMRFTTDPIYPLSTTRGNHVTYSEVTVENIGNGYSVYKYKNYDNGCMDKELFGFISNKLSNSSDKTDLIDFKSKVEGISMSLERGQCLSESFYDKSKVLKKQITYLYNDDPNRFNEHVRYLSYLPHSLNLADERFYTLSAGVYYTYYPYLKKKTEIEYFYGYSLTKEIKYEYDTKYRLLKKTQTKNSDGTIYSLSNSYVYEQADGNNIYKQMTERRMLDFKKQETLAYGDQSSFVLYDYAKGLALDNPEIILKQKVSKQEFASEVREEAQFTRYDSAGNPIEANYLSEGKVCFIWSYNKMYPVAKIVGATYDEVSAALGSLIQDLELSWMPSDESVDEIRTHLQNLDVLVTTYTYQPLLGVTSITQPNGVKMQYKYDSLGRLSIEKDSEGNILKKYVYNYGY